MNLVPGSGHLVAWRSRLQAAAAAQQHVGFDLGASRDQSISNSQDGY